MKIILLYCNKYPSIGAASRRIQNYIKCLQNSGVEIEVFSINFPLYNILFSFIIPIHTLYNLFLKNIKTDILFVYGFGWVSKLLIVIYGKLKKSKIVFEVNEKPYSIRDGRRLDILLKYFAPFNYYCLTRIVYPFVDGFIVISESLKELTIKHASYKCKIIKIPILVDYDYYNKSINTNIELQYPFMIHSAVLNDSKDGITDVFKAFALIHTQHKIPLHFYLTNKKGLKRVVNTVYEIIRENKLEKYVHFLDNPDNSILLKYQTSCYLTVINKINNEQNKYNFSTRIGEYLALGKPIITTEIGEVVNYLEDNKSCLYVTQNFPKSIADKIAYLLKNPDVADIIGKNGKKIAYEHFSIDKLSLKLKNYFENLFKKSKYCY